MTDNFGGQIGPWTEFPANLGEDSKGTSILIRSPFLTHSAIRTTAPALTILAVKAIPIWMDNIEQVVWPRENHNPIISEFSGEYNERITPIYFILG